MWCFKKIFLRLFWSINLSFQNMNKSFDIETFRIILFDSYKNIIGQSFSGIAFSWSFVKVKPAIMPILNNNGVLIFKIIFTSFHWFASGTLVEPQASFKSHKRHQKRFPCYLCGHSARSKSHLAAHMRVHTGEKPYFCTICNKRYNRKDNLYVHIRTMHRKANFMDYAEQRLWSKHTRVLVIYLNVLYFASKKIDQSLQNSDLCLIYGSV